MLRFLPALFIIAVIVGVLNYTPVKREIAYKLGISGDTTTSCCDADHLGNGEFEETANLAFFENQLVDYPKNSLAQTKFPAASNFDIKIVF